MAQRKSNKVCPECGFLNKDITADRSVKCKNRIKDCPHVFRKREGKPPILDDPPIVDPPPGKKEKVPVEDKPTPVLWIVAPLIACVVAVVFLLWRSSTSPPIITGLITPPNKQGKVNIGSGKKDHQKVVGKAVGLVVSAWYTEKEGDKKEKMSLPYRIDISGQAHLNELLGPDQRNVELEPERVGGEWIIKLRGGKGDIIHSAATPWGPLRPPQVARYYRKYLGSTGSCFLVTPDGYAITNRHVVEELDNLTRVEDRMKQIREQGEYQKIDPILLVFLVNGKEHRAEVVYVHPNIDIAILKIKGVSNAPFFALSDSDEILKGAPVIALGYPGDSRLPQITPDKERIKDQLPPDAFDYDRTEGGVRKVSKDEVNTVMVSHTAAISGGNSGGPLVDEKWHVRGINTLGVKAEFAQGIFYSVQMKQLREDIDREIRKHQEKNGVEVEKQSKVIWKE